MSAKAVGDVESFSREDLEREIQHHNKLYWEQQAPEISDYDYDRLVVTHNKADDMVCVLRPPGEDPRAILRVARLVLPEDPYEELAEQLGVPASWPME